MFTKFPNPIDKLRGKLLSSFIVIERGTKDQKVFARLDLESKPQPVVPLQWAG